LYRNSLVQVIILLTAGLTALAIFLPLQVFFGLHSLKLKDAGVKVLASCISVLWFEVFKWFRRRKLTTVKS